MGQHLARVPGEQREKLEFGGRQMNVSACTRNLMLPRVDLNYAYLVDGWFLARRGWLTTEHGSHPGQ